MLKTIVIAVAVIFVGLMITALEIALASAPQNASVCGQGVVLRANGAIVVDKWLGWDIGIPLGGPALTPVPSAAKQLTFPTQVVLGLTLTNETKICVETDVGSACKNISEIRKFFVAK